MFLLSSYNDQHTLEVVSWGFPEAVLRPFFVSVEDNV